MWVVESVLIDFLRIHGQPSPAPRADLCTVSMLITEMAKTVTLQGVCVCVCVSVWAAFKKT